MNCIEKAEKERHARNLRPTPEAKAAMLLWPDEYGRSGYGSMDFWDQLSEQRKTYARKAVQALTEEAASRIRELEKQAKMLEDDNRALRSSKYNYQRLRHIANDKRDAALADNERLREVLKEIARDAKEASKGKYAETALLDVEYTAMSALKGDTNGN